MATNFFNTPWEDRAPAERTIILAGSFGLTVFAIIKGKKMYEAYKYHKVAQTYKGDLNALIGAGQKPTYIDSQYIVFADTLMQAMDSSAFDWGTDEETVGQVMDRMRNDTDVNKLITAFGRRDNYSLPEWIAGDFSNPDKQKYVNDILRNRNIIYRF